MIQVYSAQESCYYVKLQRLFWWTKTHRYQGARERNWSRMPGVATWNIQKYSYSHPVA